MNKITFSLLVCLSSYSAFAIKQTEKYNFVFILTDEHRYDVLGCTGNDIVQISNIEKLAKEGTLFANVHVTSTIYALDVCRCFFVSLSESMELTLVLTLASAIMFGRNHIQW